MNLIQLRNFVRVVEVRNLSKAAQAVHIAQPALSRQIRALEEELGVQLLTRHGWGVAPTRAGEALALSARRILSDIASAREMVHATEHEAAGVVTVAAASSLAAALFSPLAERILAKHPRVRLRLMEKLSNPMLADVHSGAVDIGIVQKTRTMGNLTIQPLLTDHFGLLGTPDKVAGLGPITREVLSGLPLVLPTSPNELRSELDLILPQVDMQLVIEVDGLGALLEIVAKGLGYTLLSRTAAATYIAAGRLDFAPLAFPWMKREVVMISPANRLASQAVIVVQDELRALAVDLADFMRWQVDRDENPSERPDRPA